ncbi:MAG: OmpA family protein [Proteobacteria bacterium]|nr:MAG: OmpA family protein [Pseudomonadota bacterium]
MRLERLCWAAFLGVLLLEEIAAAAPAPNPLDLQFEMAELKYKVESIAGQAKDLEIKETATEIKIELSGDVLFDFDKWDIKKEAEPVLKQVADVIKEHPRSKVTVEGHTDSKGADDYNLRLSQRRAESVKGFLLASTKVPGLKVTSKGLGETRPAAPNTTPDGQDDPVGRQKNRRVEIVVKK